MRPKPVEACREPAYPTRREVLAGAVSFVLVSLTGDGIAPAADEKQGISVAPVFEHGTGRGATGCVVVSPPVFLSEEEGMQIIREELAKHGIKLEAGGTLEGVRIPARMVDYEVVKKEDGKEEFKERTVTVPGEGEPLKLDGLDSDKRIAVEFVSRNNYRALGGPISGSTVQSYQFKEVAREVGDIVRRQGKDHLFLGVFYDPSANVPLSRAPEDRKEVDWRVVWSERDKRNREESAELLRKQAQEFIGWLRKQKVIP